MKHTFLVQSVSCYLLYSFRRSAANNEVGSNGSVVFGWLGSSSTILAGGVKHGIGGLVGFWSTEALTTRGLDQRLQ